MSGPEDDWHTVSHQVESDIEELGDVEAAPPLPSATLAQLAARRGVARAAPGGGPPAKEILRLAWPVMLSGVLVNISGLVDRAMIGRLDDSVGAAVPLAAVGYATQFFFLIQSTLFAIGLACVAMMARAIGARDLESARLSLAASIQVALGLTAVLVAIMLGFAPELLALLGADAIVVEAALPYMYWVIGSAIVLAVSLVFENALRANRNTRIPMLVALLVTGVKLAGNALLIFGVAGAPGLGLTGAGIATAVSQIVGLACFAVIIAQQGPDSPLRLSMGAVFARNRLRGQVLRIAGPGVAERLVMNLAMLTYFRVLGSAYGTLAVATYAVGVPLLSFSWLPGQGYAQAGATLVGQALGAGRRDLAVRTGWTSAGLAVATAVLLGALCILGAEPLARAFTDDEDVVRELVPFLYVLAAAQPFLQLHFTLGGAHRGAGDTWTPLLAAGIGNWGFRVPIALLVAYWLEGPLLWVWLAVIFDHVARATHLAWSFRRGRWEVDIPGVGGPPPREP